ncbi:MAG: hypothetical protein ACRC7S_08945 [Cetobacterium sp.]
MKKSKIDKIIKHYTKIYKDINIDTVRDTLFLYRLEFMILTNFNERATNIELSYIRENIICKLEKEQKENGK